MRKEESSDEINAGPLLKGQIGKTIFKKRGDFKINHCDEKIKKI
jgi:hypothetical protein